MILQLYDYFKNIFNILHPPYHDGQALKELPDKIRKVLEVDAKVLKVAQVSLCLCLYDLPNDDGYDDGIVMIVIIAIGEPQPCLGKGSNNQNGNF